MERIVSLFCHVSESMQEGEAYIELRRQHDVLASYAASENMAIDNCFFHTGKFNIIKPDKVLLSLFQHAQEKELGLVLVESKEKFPLPKVAPIPFIKIRFVQEGVQEEIGSELIRVDERDGCPKYVCVYWRFS